jgi:hypothetical protein
LWRISIKLKKIVRGIVMIKKLHIALALLSCSVLVITQEAFGSNHQDMNWYQGNNDDKSEDSTAGCGNPVDCSNLSCRGRACNDHNGCTTESYCIDFQCQPTNQQDPCEDEVNECVSTTCTSTGDFSHVCNFELNTDKTEVGSCTPERNCAKRNSDGTCSGQYIIDQCILGLCVLEELCPENNKPPIICQAQNRDALPVGVCAGGANAGNICADIKNSSDCPQGVCQAQGGCLDNNPCTADGCVTIFNRDNDRYQCTYDTLNNIACNTGNACEIAECQIADGAPTCVPTQLALVCMPENECTGALLGGNIYFDFCDQEGNCMHQPIGPCLDGTACPSGNCFGVVQGACSDDSSPCFVDDQCSSGICLGGSLGFCTCENDNPCVMGVCDNTGACNPGPLLSSGTECSDGISCHDGTCDGNGNCVIVLDNTKCSTESCNDPCFQPVCTETGCENIYYTDGKVPCQVTVNNQVCQGSASCQNGSGTCIPTRPFNCTPIHVE